MANETNQDILDALTRAYNAEMETVANYLANAVNLDGVRAMEISEALQADIQEELGHAQQLAQRIKIVGGVVPGSQGLKMTQTALQPPADPTDVVSVIRGVIAAEEEAIATYKEIADLCDGRDWASQDLAIKLLADEEGHRRMFVGFLKEYERS